MNPRKDHEALNKAAISTSTSRHDEFPQDFEEPFWLIAINPVARIRKTFETDKSRGHRCRNVLCIMDRRHRISLASDNQSWTSDARQLRQKVERLQFSGEKEVR